MKCILLIHGFLSEGTDFNHIIHPLERLYDRVELFVCPGHGHRFGKDKFTHQKTIEELLNAYDELQKSYDIIDVMGFSMGGALALYLASKRDVRLLMLLAPAIKYVNFEMPFARIALAWKMLKNFNVASKNKQIKTKKKIEKEFKLVVENEAESFKLARRAFFKLQAPKYFFAFRKLIQTIHANLSPVSSKTLILWGKLDQLIPHSSIDEAQKICIHPHNKIIIYEDMTHLMLMSKNYEVIVNDVLKFIEESQKELA